MPDLRRYGVADTVHFVLIAAGTTTFTAAPVFQSEDVIIRVDGNSAAFTTNLPVGFGRGHFRLTLTAGELTGQKVMILVQDQTTLRVWEDNAIYIETYGSPGPAQHLFDTDLAKCSGQFVEVQGGRLKVDADKSSGSWLLAPTAAGRWPTDVAKCSGEFLAAPIGNRLLVDVDKSSGVFLLAPSAGGRFRVDVDKCSNEYLVAPVGGHLLVDADKSSGQYLVAPVAGRYQVDLVKCSGNFVLGASSSGHMPVDLAKGSGSYILAPVSGFLQAQPGQFSTNARSEINAEMVDALNTDTYAEPGTAAPAATTTLERKLSFLFKAWRNRVTQDDERYSVYNDDAATTGQFATVSDSGGVFDKGEVQ